MRSHSLIGRTLFLVRKRKIRDPIKAMRDAVIRHSYLRASGTDISEKPLSLTHRKYGLLSERLDIFILYCPFAEEKITVEYESPFLAAYGG
jgi:hypothetical protein